MNTRVYDISMLLAVAMIAAGAYVLWGVAVALIVTGTLVLSLTILVLAFLSRFNVVKPR